MQTIRRLALGLALLAAATAARADVFGAWMGLGAAEGARLTLSEARRGVEGALDLGEGPIEFLGERVGETVEAEIPLAEGRAYLRIAPEAAGLVLTLAPIDAENRLRADRTRAYAFVPEGTPMPEFPARFLPEPAQAPRVIDAEAFVWSYPFWSPLGAALGYEAVAPRYRTVIRLFPAVQADLLAKICRSPERTPGIAEALRGQGVACRDVLNAAPEGSAAARRLAEAADAERPALAQTLDCSTEVLGRNPDCAAAGRETARRAASTETVATVLNRIR